MSVATRNTLGARGFVVAMVLGVGCGRVWYDPLADAGADTGTATDGGPDASVDLACPTPDSDTVALYPLDDDPPTSIVDVAGGHDGTASGATGTSIPGRCGRALELPPAATPGFVVVPSSTDFQTLAVGAVDFWFRLPTEPRVPPQALSPLSRDARGVMEPGHLTVLVSETGAMAVRVQNDVFLDDAWLCSDATLAPDRWTHVGIVLGAPGLELWVDGVRREVSGDRTFSFPNAPGSEVTPNVVPCGRGVDEARSIAGNAEPFILGASNINSMPGRDGPAQSPFATGALDHLRISRVRRDFSTYAGL